MMSSSPPRGAKLPKRRKTIEVDMSWVEIVEAVDDARREKTEKTSVKPSKPSMRPSKTSLKPPSPSVKPQALVPPPLSHGAHRRHTTEVELSWLESEAQTQGEEQAASEDSTPKRRVRIPPIPREEPESTPPPKRSSVPPKKRRTKD
jgi:hypothetical protein